MAHGPKEGRLPPGLLSPGFPDSKRRSSSMAKFALLSFVVVLLIFQFGFPFELMTSVDGQVHVLQPPQNKGAGPVRYQYIPKNPKVPAGKSQEPFSQDDADGKTTPVKTQDSHSAPFSPSALQDQKAEYHHASKTQPNFIPLHRTRRRPSLDRALSKVLSLLPDEVHMRELLRPIDSGGKERMRELGLRTRLYRTYLDAWEKLHLVQDDADDETGGTYVRNDIIQYLRASSRDQDQDGGKKSDDHQDQDLAQTIRTYEAFRAFLARFANVLFPWTAPYFADHMSLHAHFKSGGRGIVLTAGDDQAPYLLTTIYSFRELGCRLPIEIMYLGDSDLGEDYRSELEVKKSPDQKPPRESEEWNAIKLTRHVSQDLPGVVTRDMSQMVNDSGSAPAGWAAKPYAILLSSFREVIFIDADSLFFQNPEILFESPDYIGTGALFFRDRLIMPESKKRWLQQVMPQPIPKLARQSRWWTGESGHMQESGVVVVDKWKHFVALLLICRFNGSDRDTRDGKEGVYEMMYGDKETFWIGFLLAGDESFAFHQGNAGAMGVVEPARAADQTPETPAPTDEEEIQTTTTTSPQQPTSTRESYTICAPQLLHLDVDNRPLWFNGWLLDNKFADKSSSKFAAMESYLIEPREVRESEAWQISEGNLACLTSDMDKKLDFSDAEKETLEMIVGRARVVGKVDQQTA
ncbi:Uu.00g121600.m01.CDS01 [Anthostomella pinea]|uniref:Uu.00g121600.m01.CDS01 n=1 Tax=Anthostomella pinea TaxID=933095 RepID=A0AAI8VHQ9_9PEZI|nr:Uu.00g121600.m01.CDS01 [Anthostomella pinea]